MSNILLRAQRLKARIPGSLRCPWCGKIADGASVVAAPEDVRQPEVGDITVCGGCSKILIFILHPEGLALRKAVTADIDPLSTEMKQTIISMVLFMKGQIAITRYKQAQNN